MKKITTKVIVLIAVLVVCMVGIYAYMSGKTRDNAKDAVLSTVQIVLSRDLQKDYPATVKEVLKYYTEIEKCFYNEEYTDEELRALGMKARELYDEELLAANEVESYMENLKADIAVYKKNNRRMTSASVAASTSVVYFEDEEDGFEFAKIHCGYTLTEKGVNYNVGVTYLMRRDESKRWKIYGWEHDSVPAISQ